MRHTLLKDQFHFIRSEKAVIERLSNNPKTAFIDCSSARMGLYAATIYFSIGLWQGQIASNFGVLLAYTLGYVYRNYPVNHPA
jgi:hypothetical protein